MADPKPRRLDIAGLADEIAALKAAVKELQTPTGTQQFNAVPALQAAIASLQAQQLVIVAQQEQITILVSDLDERITDFINDNIDDIVAAQVASAVPAALTGSDVTIGRAGGTVKIPAALTTDLTTTSGRFVVWVGGDNRIGHT